MGGWQAGTPRHDGLEEEAHKSTSQPQSLAWAGTPSPPITRSAAPTEFKVLTLIRNPLIEDITQ